MQYALRSNEDDIRLPWQSVERNRRVKEKPKYGERISASSHKIAATVEKKSWQMYVGNLKCGLNEEAVIEYCSELGVKPIEFEVISKQGNNTSGKPMPVAVRLMVKYDDRDTVMEILF